MNDEVGVRWLFVESCCSPLKCWHISGHRCFSHKQCNCTIVCTSSSSFCKSVSVTWSLPSHNARRTKASCSCMRVCKSHLTTLAGQAPSLPRFPLPYLSLLPQDTGQLPSLHCTFKQNSKPSPGLSAWSCPAGAALGTTSCGGTTTGRSSPTIVHASQTSSASQGGTSFM